jgi:anti-sigma factor RsiW
MSHVDEGTLHAYLDGELAPVERERVDAHLRGCPACQARLEEERALIERSSRLLGLAVPPERTMLPLQELRQPRLTWRLRRPLAWAATVVLAVGIGWYARGSMEPGTLAERVQLRDETPAPAPAAVATGTPLSFDSSSQGQSGGRAAELKTAPAPEAVLQSSNGIVSHQRAADELDRRKSLAAAQPGAVGGASDAPSPPAESRPAAPPPVMASRIARDAEAVGNLSSTWPLIGHQPARDLLGTEPVAIPGFGIRAYRRNPVAATPEIVVEQVLDSGTVVSLIERRLSTTRADDAATGDRGALAKEANERLARFVGSLRVEIEGPLRPDSLSRLLELVR